MITEDLQDPTSDPDNPRRICFAEITAAAYRIRRGPVRFTECSVSNSVNDLKICFNTANLLYLIFGTEIATFRCIGFRYMDQKGIYSNNWKVIDSSVICNFR